MIIDQIEFLTSMFGKYESNEKDLPDGYYIETEFEYYQGLYTGQNRFVFISDNGDGKPNFTISTKSLVSWIEGHGDFDEKKDVIENIEGFPNREDTQYYEVYAYCYNLMQKDIRENSGK